MLKVKMGARNSTQTGILVEGNPAWCNGCPMSREDIERVADLPADYKVGTVTKDQNFWYKVIEI